MRSFDDYPPIMNTAQVAELLGFADRKVVERMARAGRIPAFRLPGSRVYRFFRDDLVEWLRSDEIRVKPPASRG